MPSIAFVSGADSNYYPLLREWIASVRQFKESAGMDICIIDSGLTPRQIDELKPLVKSLINPDWPEGIPKKKTKGKERLKSCVCRPFIRDMFPGYDIYMWMDADTWVQDWSAVEMFLGSANRKKDRIVVTNGADRSNPKQIRIKWLWHWPYRIGSFFLSNGKKAFGFSVAKKLCANQGISAGCFALSAQAPHWKVWQKNLVIAAANGKLFPAEQLALGKTVHFDGYKAELLPVYAHWVCGDANPLWDQQKNAFVEPYTPHVTLGILHLCGVDNLRASKTAKKIFETMDGKQIELSLRYPHFNAGDLTVAKPKRG
jgi:hypothetical protein